MSFQYILSEEEFQEAIRDSNYKGTVAFFNGGYGQSSQMDSADLEALPKNYPTLKFIRLEVNESMEVSQIFEQAEAWPCPVFQVTTYNFTVFIISFLFLLG